MTTATETKVLRNGFTAEATRQNKLNKRRIRRDLAAKVEKALAEADRLLDALTDFTTVKVGGGVDEAFSGAFYHLAEVRRLAKRLRKAA